ncbi:chromosome associated protein [Ramicandelaber brevisporus]|nr:chromosome associated protein [Ramicandelaber brevisporus]
MHIKSITIQGFKSYKDASDCQDFSERSNVIIGRNGSGKSNFFSAVRFVLSDAYTNLSKEERQSLLHEGIGPATMSAFVEIVFDNSDNRFPTNRPETVIRRTIGLKKDEYSLDHKAVKLNVITSMLEAAGFSRSNPYYVIPQGRISALTHAKDYERLNLLKEVAGTSVYESRRNESETLMAEARIRRGKIDESLDYIKERLNDLDREKTELKEYQEVDKSRRALEHALFSAELEEAIQSLQDLEDSRENSKQQALRKREDLDTINDEINQLEINVQNARIQVEKNNTLKGQLNEDLENKIKVQTQLQLTEDDASVMHQLEATSVDDIQSELESVNNELTEQRTLLETHEQELQQRAESEQAARDALEEAQATRQAIEAKQARSGRFHSLEERDSWLNKEIEECSRQIIEGEQQVNIAQHEHDELKEQNNSIQQLLDTMEQRLKDNRLEETNVISKQGEIDSDINSLTDERKQAWRKEDEYKTVLNNAQTELAAIERRVAGVMDKHTFNGIRDIDDIARNNGINGVHGPLYKLFTVDNDLRAAVEAIAGNSLFHVVVDSDEVASQMFDAMSKSGNGLNARLTFMPLNRLRVKPLPQLSKDELDNDNSLLIDCLNYNKNMHGKAFEQVFGQAILCRSLEDGTNIARIHGATAVTIDGDKVERRGGMSGGYIDRRSSRLALLQQYSDLTSAMRDAIEQLENARKSARQLDEQITRKRDEGQLALSRLNQVRRAREQLVNDSQVHFREKQRLDAALDSASKSLRSLSASITSARNQLQDLQNELSSTASFTQQAAEAEQAAQQLASIIETIQQRDRVLAQATEHRMECEHERNNVATRIHNDLIRQQQQLASKLDSLTELERQSGSVNAMAMMAEQRTAELGKLKREINEIKEKLGKIEVDIENDTKRATRDDKSIEKARAAESAIQRWMDQHKLGVERFMTKRNMLLQKRDEASTKLRDLGVLPQEAMDEAAGYAEKSTERLLKKLHKIKDTLRTQYGHINKQAAEQYTSFNRQKEKLENDKNELIKDEDAIGRLMQHLDQQKDEAIERTFRQVAFNFKQVFAKLVPGGNAQLIMQTKAGAEMEKLRKQAAKKKSSAKQRPSTVDNYTGIAIKVSFTGAESGAGSASGLRMQQLSGGQKTVVALALIFAIQRCDPAPFYLFDEIDANLDAAYRSAVANMIHNELSSTAQFIMTTFRPELLEKAEKIYGVTFQDKVSQIAEVDRDTARQFIMQSSAPVVSGPAPTASQH